MEISEYLKDFKLNNKKTSERAEIIKEIYEIYISKKQTNHRKKANWKRYIIWLKKNKIPDSKENQNKFRRSKEFIKTRDIKSFCFLLSHIKTKDLYYILSVGKDMENRDQNFSGYLLGNILNK